MEDLIYNYHVHEYLDVKMNIQVIRKVFKGNKLIKAERTETLNVDRNSDLHQGSLQDLFESSNEITEVAFLKH